jgi:hypothetical protein
MKWIATLAIAVTLVPGLASACGFHEQHATDISCAAGQVFDEATRTCVPQTG